MFANASSNQCKFSGYAVMRRIARQHTYLLALLLAALWSVTAAGQDDAPWTTVHDQWFLLEIDDAPVGWSHDVIAERNDLIRSQNRFTMRMRRGNDTVVVEASSTMIEARNGRPISFESLNKAGTETIRTLFSFEDDRVLISTFEGDRRVNNEMPLPGGDWLTPRASDRYIRKRREAGAHEITTRVLMPDQGLEPIGIETKYRGDTTYEYNGRVLPVTQWRTQTTALPSPADELISSDGHIVYQSLQAGFGKLVTRVVDEADALAALKGDAPELMVASFVAPDRKIERSLDTRRAKFRVRTREGDMPKLPSVGVQRITMDEDTPGEAVITVDLSRPLPADDQDAGNQAYRGNSAMIDGNDALVRALAQRAVRGIADDDLMQRAEALRRAAYQRISNKGYETAFASASETARTRRGDCSEHAVLLAAMLRSVDIPARVASGLVYVPDVQDERGVFGWHMWTQALIDGHWIDLDGTLPGRHTFHACFVLTSTSALQDGAGEREMNSVMMLIGNIEIDVLEYSFE